MNPIRIYVKNNFLYSQTIPRLAHAALEYSVDHAQRNVIFWDVIRKRGNGYIEHIAAGQPPVLIFKYKMFIDARTFERPVNYGLVKILRPKGVKTDKTKRPFVIIDPRAGHGSGIGGFKDDSQVGVAIRAGHPVYFVIFFPDPEPNQTLYDVAGAEATFLRAVAERHPHSPKPCVIGNCQGGWAIMALAAARPDITGVIVINGAPLSYWAGENGKSPMRYAGGILGGSWLAQLAGDLGHGKFDGANLIMNFEELDPANSYWKKYYNLFNAIDTEEKRFLKFERWWGGFSLMNSKEMRGIVDNLFIGNKLAHGKVPLDETSNIDLRNIHLPIIVFCSEGDNITSPQQALNWISDVYSDVLEIKLAGHIIVYLVHQSVGHLGIFVSGSIAKKEHSQIVDLLNYVEHLPPGLYEMIIHEEPNANGSTPRYTIALKERTIADIKSRTNKKHKYEEKLFNIAQVVSDFNVMAYDFFMGPTVRALANDHSAAVIRQLQPLRSTRYLLSDNNPLMWPVAFMAPHVRAHRSPAALDNPFFEVQQQASEFMTNMMDTYRDLRDSNAELLFHWVYGLLNISLPTDLPFRDKPTAREDDDRYDAMNQNILATIEDGGTPEAILRILLLLIRAQESTKGSYISTGIKKLRESDVFAHLTDDQFRSLAHWQTVVVEFDPEQAFKTLPALLKSPEDRQTALDTVRSILQAINSNPSEKTREIMGKIDNMFTFQTK